MFRKFPHVKQNGPLACGLTCIKIVAAFHKKFIDVNDFTHHLSDEGLSLYDLCRIAEESGFQSAAHEVTVDDLKKLKLPLILHWNGNHYVVLYRISRRQFHISNPAGSLETISRKEFNKSFLKFQANEKGRVISLLPGQFFIESNSKGNFLSAAEFLSRHLKPYRSRLRQLLGILILITFTYALLPFLTRAIIDIGIEGKDFDFITIILIANISLLLFRSSGEWIRSTLSLHIASRIKISIVTDYLTKIFRLPIGFVEKNLVGDIIQRSTDQERIQNFISSSLVSIVMGVLLLLVYGVILFIFHQALFWIFLAGTASYIGWVIFFFEIRKKMDLQYYRMRGENQSVWFELLNGFEDIKLNGYDLVKRWKWEKIQAGLYRIGIKLMNIDRFQQLGADFLNGLKDIALTFYGAYLVTRGEMTLGTLLSIQFIIGQLSNPTAQIINFIKSSQSAFISYIRVNDINIAKEEQEDRIHLIKNFVREQNHDIAFKNVSFRYEGGKNLTLNTVNFKIPEYKITAIVGASGSGKSTVLKLISKIYDNYSGEILIGESSLANYDNSYLRKRTGYVMQNSRLYRDTILNNIVMADEKDYNILLVHKVLTWVNLDQEIKDQFQDGIYTMLKEGGEGLSQGQKQRLLLARALYKRPKFLILDEFTNAIDTRSEEKIIDLFTQGLSHQTIILVSHKLSTIKCADHIVVMDKGRVMEQGSYTELSGRKGFFSQLFKLNVETPQMQLNG